MTANNLFSLKIIFTMANLSEARQECLRAVFRGCSAVHEGLVEDLGHILHREV